MNPLSVAHVQPSHGLHASRGVLEALEMVESEHRLPLRHAATGWPLRLLAPDDLS